MKTKPLIALPVLLAAFALVGCADESPEKRIASAKEYLQKKDTKSAVIEIKNALQKNPELGEARYMLGSNLLAEGNVVAAEVELRKALAAKHPEVEVVPDLARSMLMLGQAKKVVDEFGGTRLGQPGADASLQTTLVAAYAALGKPDQAQAALSAALAADPKYAPALLISARQKAGTKDFDGALAVVDDVVTREPGNADAWKLKGDLLLYTMNKPDDALTAYRKALEVNAKYGPAHVAVLSLLMQQGKLDEVANQLEQLKTFAANNPQTKYFEAQLAYQKKDFKRAQEVVQPLLQQAPNNPQLLQLAGAVELQLGAVAQAEIYLSKATQLAPQLAPARRLLIATYVRLGQSAKALAALNAATGKDGIEPALYSLAGEVYLQNGDAKKAEEYFAKALKLDPENARKRTAVAITHLASGQTAGALGELQEIAASDSGVTADLALISAHVQRKEFDKALAAINKLEAKQPDKPMAANLRGRIQLAQKDNAAARKSFERALAIDPNFFAAAASLAALDVAEKKPDEAKKRFETLLAKNPKNGQALLALAQLAAVNNAGKDEVAAQLTKAVDANPTDVAPRLLLIDLHLRNKDNKQALATAQSAVTAAPSSPELLAALGRVQQVSGDLNQAIATYGKLVALQPLSPVPHVRLAEAHVVNKDLKAAEQSLRKALEIKPDTLEAQRGLVTLALDSKRYEDAVKVARSVQEQRPAHPVGYALEGDIRASQRNWDAAAQAYRSGLQRAASTELAIKLNAALVSSGKASESERFVASWRKEHPKDAAFLLHLGDLALMRKDHETAEKQYLAVLAIQPDSAVAHNNLAWTMGLSKREGALAHAEQANRIAPNQPAFMDTMAMLLADSKEFAKAIELQRKALELQPSNAGLRLNLAKIYIKAGDSHRAKTELDALAQLGGKFTAQAEVTALLKSL
jgi:putative PEP-CTERM system TPR-repeat lipoprotein